MHSTPRRTPPHVAWLLPMGVLFLMGGILLGRSLPVWLPALGMLALGGVAALCARGWLLSLAVGVVCMGLGALASFGAYHPVLPAEGLYTVVATVADEIDVDSDGQVQTILTGVTLNGRPAPDAYWTYYLDEDELPPEWLLPGQTLALTAEVYHPGGRTNPGGFDFREYLLQQGVEIGLYGAKGLAPAKAAFSLRGTMANMRHSLSLHLMEVMGPEAGGYAAAMLLGTKRYLPETDEECFRRLGVAHILSISGFHVGLMAGMLRLLLRPLPVGRKARALTEAAALLAYCLLTGGNAPVLRASGMLLWRQFTRLRHKRVLPLHMVCVTAALQLIFSPAQLFSASFQLTYGAMLGILLVTPWLNRRKTFRTHSAQKLWEAFCLALGAQLGVLLPQLYWFGELPLLSLLLNMAVIPFGSILISFCWLTLLALPVPILRAALGLLAAGMTHLLTAIVRWMGAWDGISLWTRQADAFTLTGWLLLLWGLSMLLPRRMRKARRPVVIVGILLMLTILLPLPQGEPCYIQFDVGDADAALLQDGDMTVVIDAGEDGQALAGYLHKRRQSVDMLILTHLHIDHGGIAALMEKGIPVDVCYLPADAETPVIDEEVLPLLSALAETGTTFRYLGRGDVIDLPSGCLRALWPEKGRVRPEHDANDVCLVLQAEVGGVTMLLASDLSGLYSKYAALPADILKAPHHGSTVSCTPELLEMVQPQIILQSNKDENRAAYLAELAGDTPLYATDRHGAVTIRFTGEGQFAVMTICSPASDYQNNSQP